MSEITERIVDSSDGVRIATYEQGNPDGPTLLLAHGWPDSHVLWDGAVPLLEDRFRIIRYDNRAVGKSTVPEPVKAYRMERFADDLEAVIGALSARPTGARAGSRLGFGGHLGIPDPARRGDRIASFTSVSGPSTDHYKAAIWADLARPHRPRRFGRALSRMLRLTYMFPLSVPVISPAAVRWLFGSDASLTDGVPAGQRYRGATFATDMVNSLKIYRAMTSANPRSYRARPLRRRAGTADRQHQGPGGSSGRPRRRVPLGSTVVAPRYQGRPLVADVARADDRTVGARARRPSRRQSRRVGHCCAHRSGVRANTSATLWFP